MRTDLGNAGGWRGLCNAVAGNARLSDSIGGVRRDQWDSWRIILINNQKWGFTTGYFSVHYAVAPLECAGTLAGFLWHFLGHHRRWSILQLQLGDRGFSHPAYLY